MLQDWSSSPVSVGFLRLARRPCLEQTATGRLSLLSLFPAFPCQALKPYIPHRINNIGVA